ncbi:MAG: DinB family protein [Planctomycetota bacterium]
MNLTDILKGEIDVQYRATESLMKLVDADKLDWKPTGESADTKWFTTGELLSHLTNACGFCCKAFATGDWGSSMGGGPKSIGPDEALKALAEDKQTALATIAEVGEDALHTRKVVAPWDQSKTEVVIGKMFHDMIGHLSQHKSQLFYYLKLQGKPVHTGHLWGM